MYVCFSWHPFFVVCLIFLGTSRVYNHISLYDILSVRNYINFFIFTSNYYRCPVSKPSFILSFFSDSCYSKTLLFFPKRNVGMYGYITYFRYYCKISFTWSFGDDTSSMDNENVQMKGKGEGDFFVRIKGISMSRLG